MGNRKAMRTVLALMLLAAMTVSLCPVALAADAEEASEEIAAAPTAPSNDLRVYGDVFEADQYFDCNESLQNVYTVQVVATNNLDAAKAVRDGLLKAGFDSFVYQYNGTYRVMCGKFAEDYDASCYSESIHGYTDMDQAYVTRAYLPEESVDAFAAAFYPHVMISEDRTVMQTYWEKPTGAFFREDGPNTASIYTVQCSTGASFQGAEAYRDEMIAMGYPSFVFKCDMHYKTMVGAFSTINEAYAFLKTFQAATGYTNAIVVGVMIPASEVAKLVP